MGDKQALRERLAEIGQRDDADFPLAEAALVSAALDRPEIDLSPYIEHLMSLGAEVQTVEAHAAEERAQRLSDLLHGKYGYQGDEEDYDNPRNADLIDVIDRRRGLPVAVAIIYLQAARDAGWEAYGLDFPGHFIIRVDGESDRAILDPFHGGKLIPAQNLRDLLKSYVGPQAELMSKHYSAVSDRSILLRLLNNARGRALETGETARGLEIMDRMLLAAPRTSVLWLESGIIQARTGQMRGARKALEHCLTLDPPEDERSRAEQALRELQARFN